MDDARRCRPAWSVDTGFGGLFLNGEQSVKDPGPDSTHQNILNLKEIAHLHLHRV